MSISNPIEQLYPEELYQIGPKVLVIIPQAWDATPESDQLLLSKILGSVKRTLASVQILSLSEADADDLKFYNPSKIIAFGSALKAAGQSIQANKPLRHNQITLLQADNFDQLDEAKKKTLWYALREMFEV